MANYFAIERYEGSTVTAILENGEKIQYNPQTKRWSSDRYITRTFVDNVETFEQHEKLDTMLNISYEELGDMGGLVKTMNIFELNKFIKQDKHREFQQ